MRLSGIPFSEAFKLEGRFFDIKFLQASFNALAIIRDEVSQRKT